jgi:TonB family protein
VRREINRRLHEARACYERAAELDPGLFGVVRVEMTIGAAGRVEAVVIGDSTLEDRAFAECLSSRIREWSFPHPSGEHVTVHYPMIFHRAG